MTKPIKTYDKFWPYYLQEHRKPATRGFHYLGTLLGVAVLITALATRIWWLLAVAFVSGYFFAWVAHFFIEKNRPATFTYPWWSFISDLRMVYFWLTGRLGKELDRHEITGPAGQEA